MKITTLDTTLRDGTQGEAVSFTVDDKLAIAQRLDDLGIDYIEGGWPGSNPRDKDFFARAKDLKLRHARLTAFGSTRFAKNRIDRDPNVRALVDAGTPVICIFGKTWDLHTTRALNITEEENLKLISETVRFLKDNGREVIFDAEHFFDGYTSNSAFALRALEAAKTAGADILCLCDTNGGSLTARIVEIVPKCASGSTARSASTPTTTPNAPSPTPSPPSSRASPTFKAASTDTESAVATPICAPSFQTWSSSSAIPCRPRPARQPHLRGALRRGTGQSAAPQRPALRRP